MSSDSEIITCTGAWLDVHYIYVASNSVQPHKVKLRQPDSFTEDQSFPGGRQ